MGFPHLAHDEPVSDLKSAGSGVVALSRAHTATFAPNLDLDPRQVLEDRLSDRKEALLERELVLEEVVSLTKKLRKQASDGRQETLQLSKKVTAGVGHERVKYMNRCVNPPEPLMICPSANKRQIGRGHAQPALDDYGT